MEEKFTKEELEHLKSQMNRVGSHLPEDMAGLVWDSYNKINGRYEAMPCTCAKSASLWANAVNTIRDYLKGLSE